MVTYYGNYNMFIIPCIFFTIYNNYSMKIIIRYITGSSTDYQENFTIFLVKYLFI